DDVGTRMWQAISEHKSTERVVETITTEYEVDEQQCRRDLNQLILKLSEKGLVKADAEETAPSQ
ncbi:MAG: PqqD family protein, partial [Deltaproteobacteria bacterium]|nr:PqqD family protein [Deltaproteobacteria bacterium]